LCVPQYKISFCNYAGHESGEGPSAEDTENSFNQKDENGDGKITIKEHDEHMLEWIKGLADQQMAKADTNDDGHIDKEEFLVMRGEGEL
jgi:Ca2+-binding EF-hand superfamily protein